MSNHHSNTVRELYTGVRGIAVKVLSRVERTDAYLEKLLNHELRSTELSGQDKALLYEIVHGVIRWNGRLDWILSGFYKGQFSKALPLLKNVLRVALYQILFLDKIPEYAAVNDAVEFIKKFQGQKPADITNAVLRNIIKNKANIRYPDPQENLIGYISTYHSHPAWMVKRWLSRYGREGTEALLKSNNERPVLTLRVNTLKISIEAAKSLFDSLQIKYEQGKYLPDFFKIAPIPNFAQWQYFTEGYFAVQDESAGLACFLLDIKPGMTALDLCAAPGGKTAFIGGMLKNEGSIDAVDLFETRLRSLEENVARIGINNVTTHYKDALEFLGGPYDRIMVDVSCSGFGTLSKKPDIKWKKELIDIKRNHERQLKILQHAATLLKPDGALVYSTCTIEPEENIDVVMEFLAANPEFHIDNAGKYLSADVVDGYGCVQTLPHIHKTDGAFSARLIRK